MLTTDVQTTTDLMSIALLAEHEAVRRYASLADAMRQYGNKEAAALFERMVEEERGHERLIEEWAKLEHIQLRTDLGPIVWKDPQVSTAYDREAVDPAHSTPYRALAFAVHNEERAFRFYAQVAATAEDERVREYAETLAREELGHAALLRAMRRRAWRAEQGSRHEDPDIDPASIRTLADLLAVAACAERCLADNLDMLADSHPQLQQAGRSARALLAGIEAQLADAGTPGADATSAVESIERYREKTAALADDPEVLLQRLRSDSDRCFAFYDAVVSQASDEAVMLAAQKLSGSALERINQLREDT